MGDAAPRREPVRTCVGCRQSGERSELRRYVVVDGWLASDPAKALPGRGAWLHDSAACWELAVRRKAFGRALRARVDVGVDETTGEFPPFA